MVFDNPFFIFIFSGVSERSTKPQTLLVSPARTGPGTQSHTIQSTAEGHPLPDVRWPEVSVVVQQRSGDGMGRRWVRERPIPPCIPPPLAIPQYKNPALGNGRYPRHFPPPPTIPPRNPRSRASPHMRGYHRTKSPHQSPCETNPMSPPPSPRKRRTSYSPYDLLPPPNLSRSSRRFYYPWGKNYFHRTRSSHSNGKAKNAIV